MDQGKACFVVRAEVPDAADRPGFDKWYAEEHLPDAVRLFGAEKGWRGWSKVDPSVHYAYYAFPSMAKLEASVGGDTLKGLIADFDKAWGARDTRSRDMVEIVGMAAG